MVGLSSNATPPNDYGIETKASLQKLCLLPFQTPPQYMVTPWGLPSTVHVPLPWLIQEHQGKTLPHVNVMTVT